MVFGTQLKSVEKKDLRCTSVDSGVSVALNNSFKRRILQLNSEFNDFQEELLDFEPDSEENNQSQSGLVPQLDYDSNRSTVKNFKLDEHAISNYTPIVDNRSNSTISIAHRKNMLPVPKRDSRDGRQYQYLPLYYPPRVGARTLIDSSSDDNSVDFEVEANQLGMVQEDNSGTYSMTQETVAHRRDMLPVPKSDAKNGRQYQYLPLYYPPRVGARILIDSSSDDNSIDFEVETNHSGTVQEDDSSTYSLTQEAEDRLLESDGEESQAEHLLIRTDAVETCQIGNARITLPKFITASPRGSETNDLKRTKSTAKLKTLECKKKKKWDLSFRPECPVTRVLLDDIGYVDVDDGGSITESEGTSGLSEPQVDSLIVVCNKDDALREGSGRSPQREIISLTKNEGIDFKLPLPPPKRPPTRPKRTVRNSEGSGKNLQIKVLNKEARPPPKPHTFTAAESRHGDDNALDKGDDSISLIASTLGVADDVANINDVEEVSSLVSNEQFEHNFEPQEGPHYVSERVKEWVQNMPPPEATSSIPSLLNVIADSPIVPQQNLPKRGITVMPPVTPKGNIRVNFKDVPKVFAGLCYHHFLSSNCAKANCKLPHFVKAEQFNFRLQKKQSDEVMRAFQFAMRFETLFKDVYPSFLNVFGTLKMQNDLISCIKYFLQMEDIDSTEAIGFVIDALEKSGLSFQEAIETISFNIGFLEHPVLADILLDLITRKYDISKHWDVLKRIAKARGWMTPSIADRILVRVASVYPLNKELCLEIYDTIVKSNMTDVSQISKESLVPYKKLLDLSGVPRAGSPKPQIQPVTVPNPREVLAAHIDSNLIRERQYYEREVEGAKDRSTLIRDRVAGNFNYESSCLSPCDNQSQSSGSDGPYFVPSPKPGSSGQRNDPLNPKEANTDHFRDAFSLPSSNNSNSAYDMDTVYLNAALRFEPPPNVSAYVPENVGSNVARDDPEVEVTLTPSRPIFGRARYRSDFSFRKSLHNLLPDSFEHVDINERDVVKLNSVIRSKNGPEFYRLLQYYVNPTTVQNFITMTMASLKSIEGIYDTLMGLVRSIESVKPDYARNKEIKAVVEVITMNLLFELERKGLWSEAGRLLELFCDWDSLVSSKLFQVFSKRQLTPMGRYIFLAKMFVKAKNFHFTYEIIQSPNLRLLEAPETWPYFHNTNVDFESRSAVLKEFFKCAYHQYIIGVSDLYKRVYKYGGIFGFDAQGYFNPMLIVLINGQQKHLLKYFHADIDVYYKPMDKNVLRAFTILLEDQLDQKSLFRLYELCCQRQIYTKFTGDETSITVRNNMLMEELRLILSYYFYKLSKSKRMPWSNVTVEIKLLENKPPYPKMLQRCVRSIKQINDAVRQILRDRFSVTASGVSEQRLTAIEIPQQEIAKWLQCNQRRSLVHS